MRRADGVQQLAEGGAHALGNLVEVGEAVGAGEDNGPPGLRPQYHPNYYGAFIFDLDGHNVEAVCHAPE